MSILAAYRRNCMDKAEAAPLESVATFAVYLNEHPDHPISVAADQAGITGMEATGILNWQWSKS